MLSAASRFTFFKGETLYCYGLRCAPGNSPENTSEKAEKIQASGMVAYHVRRFSWGRGSLPGCDITTSEAPEGLAVLQWGRGLLPGYDETIMPISVTEKASMGPGIAPRI